MMHKHHVREGGEKLWVGSRARALMNYAVSRGMLVTERLSVRTLTRYLFIVSPDDQMIRVRVSNHSPAHMESFDYTVWPGHEEAIEIIHAWIEERRSAFDALAGIA